ncbi:MAG: zinc ribbon domain-containing protein [Acidobacteria bacterium]|nr:MAG: zinc ribbon domain-containing protein [Acidobacteriota bacterium]
MICPSCGTEMDTTSEFCRCGARRVGPPPTEPVDGIPRLRYGISAFILAGLTFIVQLVITIRNIAIGDLRWPWQLLVTTASLALVTLPVLLLAMALAWRGWRLAVDRPQAYGGRALARRSLTLSLALCLLNLAALAGRLPDWLENARIKRQARTRVLMYKVNDMIARYREQYGAYPERLIDLQELDPSIGPILDTWHHPLVYTPMSAEIASRGLPVPFQKYELVSRGPDGLLGTEDDIVMRDGLIVGPTPPEELEVDAGEQIPQ